MALIKSGVGKPWPSSWSLVAHGKAQILNKHYGFKVDCQSPVDGQSVV